jgi:CBS domain-containing protein
MAIRSIREIVEQRRLVSCSGDVSVRDAACLLKGKQVGAVLVVEAGKLTGIFTERDALFRVVAEGRDPQVTRVADVMTPHPQTIQPDRPFSAALHIMHEGGFRHVPVVENGVPVGVLSARDALGPELEDFVFEMLRQEQAQDILA